jgi:hypothetical protein
VIKVADGRASWQSTSWNVKARKWLISDIKKSPIELKLRTSLSCYHKHLKLLYSYFYDKLLFLINKIRFVADLILLIVAPTWWSPRTLNDNIFAGKFQHGNFEIKLIYVPRKSDNTCSTIQHQEWVWSPKRSSNQVIWRRFWQKFDNCRCSGIQLKFFMYFCNDLIKFLNYISCLRGLFCYIVSFQSYGRFSSCHGDNFLTMGNRALRPLWWQAFDHL